MLAVLALTGILGSCAVIQPHLFAPSNWVIVKNGEGAKYFSFASNSEVSPDSQSWDVAFTYDRLIYTNSGVSAKGPSSGGGAVDFSGTDDYDSVVNASGADFGGERATDKRFYVLGDGFLGLGSGERILNAMTFIGYSEGDGSEAHPFPPSSYLYNQEQFYRAEGLTVGPPTYIMTNRVYFIRSGDGQRVYKFQVLMDSPGGERDWGFRFELM